MALKGAKSQLQQERTHGGVASSRIRPLTRLVGKFSKSKVRKFTRKADTVLAVALFEIRPYLAFANFVACYGLDLQRINTSLLWASPVPGTPHSVCNLPDLPLIPHHPSDDFSKSKKLSQRYNERRKAEQSDDTQGTHR